MSGVPGAGDASIFFLIVRAVIIGIVWIAWHFSRSRSLLEQWADRNGFELIATEHRNLVRGPFFWTYRKGADGVPRHRPHAGRRGAQGVGPLRRVLPGAAQRDVDVRWDE